jgi:hypothetical protein
VHNGGKIEIDQLCWKDEVGKGKGEDSKEEGKAAKTMDVRGAARRSVSGKNQTVIE